MLACHRMRELLLVVVCVLPLSAQSAPDSQQKPDTPIETGQESTFKSTVDVVNILFNVKDKHGALIPNLKKDDFDVSEDGGPQKIKYFAAESNLPLTLGMLIDTSGSQARVLPMEQDAGVQFLKEVLRPKDLAFALNFDVNIELLQDFTSSVSELRQALNSVRINTGGHSVRTNIPGVGQGPVDVNPRTTALYDAIYLAANDKLGREVGRKAMIILTDGEDYGSKLKIQDAIEAAQRADSICYVLLVADAPFYGGRGGYHGVDAMKRLAEETGGRMIDVGNRQTQLKDAFDQIADELRSQYSIGYSPTNNNHDGTFRRIEIKTKAGKVQARKGYYASR